ncbi:MAG: YtfJ family protein [Polyangiaceae bacterium]
MLAKGDKYKEKVALAAVADLDGYNYWPVKGFVIDAIKEESKKAGTTIFCDWDGGVRSVYGFKKKTSSIVLIDKNGWVIFSQEGALSAESRTRLIELLRQQVE